MAIARKQVLRQYRNLTKNSESFAQVQAILVENDELDDSLRIIRIDIIHCYGTVCSWGLTMTPSYVALLQLTRTTCDLFPQNSPIIPELYFMLLRTNYSGNYAGILDASLMLS